MLSMRAWLKGINVCAPLLSHTLPPLSNTLPSQLPPWGTSPRLPTPAQGLLPYASLSVEQAPGHQALPQAQTAQTLSRGRCWFYLGPGFGRSESGVLLAQRPTGPDGPRAHWHLSPQVAGLGHSSHPDLWCESVAWFPTLHPRSLLHEAHGSSGLLPGEAPPSRGRCVRRAVVVSPPP